MKIRILTATTRYSAGHGERYRTFDPKGLDAVDHWVLYEMLPASRVQLPVLSKPQPQPDSMDQLRDQAFIELAKRLGHEVEFDLEDTGREVFEPISRSCGEVQLNWSDYRHGHPTWESK